MNTGRKLDQLLHELGRAPVPVEAPDVIGERSARAVDRIAVSIQDAARERAARRRTSALVALAAAALVVLAIGGVWRALAGERGASGHFAAAGSGPMLHGSASGVVLGRGGREQPASASAGVPLVAGDELSTASDAKAVVELASGARATLTPMSRIALSSTDPRAERLLLTLGMVSVTVPPLGAGASLSVATPQALVVVHGTAFTVRVEREATHVAVSEGRVSVESRGARWFLGPGDHWSSAAASEIPTARTATEPPTPAVSAASAATSASPVAPAVRPSAHAPSSASQLAAHNALLASAMAARRRGDDRTALARLDELLARDPNGPLAPEARVERFRALKRLGRDSEAAREARRYLHEQRDGAARDEARDVALSGK